MHGCDFQLSPVAAKDVVSDLTYSHGVTGVDFKLFQADLLRQQG